MPGGIDDVAQLLQRLQADCAQRLSVPRRAAATENTKVAFCQSFSVQSLTRRKRADLLAPVCEQVHTYDGV